RPHAVVGADVALAPCDADLPVPEQPVEQRARNRDLAPAPVQPRATALDEGAPRERSLTAEPLENRRGDVSVPLEETGVDPASEAPALPVPPVDGKLLAGKAGERLV